jgi:hypothetical protein
MTASKKPRAKKSAPPAATGPTCEWFANCGQPATGTTPHPVLSAVPTCDRCHQFATGKPRAPAVKLACIATGDRVRSYDFEPRPGRGACYVEGAVCGVNPERNVYAISCSVDVFDGVDMAGSAASRVGKIIFSPMELVVGEYPGRITRL